MHHNFEQDEIMSVVLRDSVTLDSICDTEWDAFRDGVKEILHGPDGILITWNFGATFVPWSNVVFAKKCYIRPEGRRDGLDKGL